MCHKTRLVQLNVTTTRLRRKLEEKEEIVIIVQYDVYILQLIVWKLFFFASDRRLFTRCEIPSSAVWNTDSVMFHWKKLVCSCSDFCSSDSMNVLLKPAVCKGLNDYILLNQFSSKIIATWFCTTYRTRFMNVEPRGRDKYRNLNFLAIINTLSKTNNEYLCTLNVYILYSICNLNMRILILYQAHSMFIFCYYL